MSDFATREEMVSQIQQLGYDLHLKDVQINELITRVGQLDYQVSQLTNSLASALSDQSKYWQLSDWIQEFGDQQTKDFLSTL